MPEMGEKVTNLEIFVDEDHDENKCPWHQKTDAASKEMEKQSEDEDKRKGKVRAGRTRKQMPQNDGGTLGDRLIKLARENPPDQVVEIYFVPEGTQQYKDDGKDKQIVLYASSAELRVYGLDYAAHHLIPGNAALKDSAIAPYLGDETTVKHFSKTSKIEKGSAGYDVNCTENGVWLPSPYALSMNGGNDISEWPGEKGMKAALKAKGKSVYEAQESFKLAYAREAVRVSSDHQFHMVHTDYSEEVKRHLNSVKVKMMRCPVVKEEKDKYDPPQGLPQVLHRLSKRLKQLLTTAVWHPPFLVDDINTSVATPKPGVHYAVAKVDKVI